MSRIAQRCLREWSLIQERKLAEESLRVHQVELEEQNEELRSKQTELDASRARYFDLYDLAPVGYLTFNESGLIKEANIAAATMLGVTRNVLLQNILLKFIFHEDEDIFYLQRKRLIDAGDSHVWEMRMVRSDGSVFWADLQANPALNGEYLITFTDISESKRVNVALKERNKELNCLYGISTLMELPGISLDELLKKIILTLPPAWQFPEITEANIELEGQTFQTLHFRETSWVQIREIIVNGNPVGQVKICYLEERSTSNEGPFLIEERHLLNAIAERIGLFIERKRSEDKLLEINRQLENTNYELTILNEELEQRRIEAEATQKKLQQLSSAVVNSPVTIVITDHLGRIEYVNPKFTEISGYLPEEAIGKNPRIMNAGGQPKELYRGLWETILAGREWHGDLCNRKKNDEIYLEHVSISPIKDERGNITNFVAIKEDVTEQRRIAGELLMARDMACDAKDRLSLAAKAGGVGIWDYDVVNNVLVWDDQMYRLYGITPDKFGGAYDAWKAGLHQDDLQRGDSEIQMALRGEKEFDTEFRVVWPDGTIHNIRAIAIVQRDSLGQPLHMIGTNWDITNSKLAEEELRQKEESLQLAQNLAHLGSWEWNLKDNSMWWSDEMYKLLDYEMGVTIPSLERKMARVHPDDMNTVNQAISNFLREKQPFKLTHRIVRTNGDMRYVAVEFNKTHLDQTGTAEVAMGIVHDITEQVLVEKTREDIELITRHDLKTPLNPIINIPEVLLMDTNLTPEQINWIKMIKTSGYRMLNIIDSSLSLYKMEQGSYILTPVSFNLFPLITDIEREAAQDLDKKRLKLLRSINAVPVEAGDSFMLNGEVLLCYTMLSNLIKNAIEASPPDEVITVSCGQDEVWNIIGIHNRGAVPEKIRTGFFDKYVTHGKKTGTGLGTYSAALAARTLKGDISMTTSEDTGTLITVRLPKTV